MMGLRYARVRVPAGATGVAATTGAGAGVAAHAATPTLSTTPANRSMPFARRLISERLRIAVERPTAVRTDVDAAEPLRVARDVQDQPPLVLVVVDAHPGRAAVRRPEEAALPLHGADQIQRRRLPVLGRARRRLAEAERVDLL